MSSQYFPPYVIGKSNNVKVVVVSSCKFEWLFKKR